MPLPTLKRGARPTPRSVLVAAKQFAPLIGAPADFIRKPAASAVSFWGNDQYGDCVTAEEAFSKVSSSPQTQISNDDAINWAKKHNFLNGAYLTDVMTAMQNDGFLESSVVYDDGPYASVNWRDGALVQSAIYKGNVKLGIAAGQLETTWYANEGRWGWFGTKYKDDDAEDHSVALCGYGTISYLAAQLGAKIPNGIDGTDPGYAMFTWNSIGIIDVPSMIAITQEAWLRQPTTVANTYTGFSYLQCQSSGQYLNILNAARDNGAEACQGVNNTTDNFLWKVIPAADGYCYLQVRSSGQYLNILDASKANGAEACQGTNKSTDNFLWKVIPAADGYCYLQVKSSGQYLNVLNASKSNGAMACQGVDKSTPNFLWKILPA